MAIELYSKSNTDIIDHFGYLQYQDLEILRNEAAALKLACLQFLPYGGDILFNAEQAHHIVKSEIPLLRNNKKLILTCHEALYIIHKAALAVSQKYAYHAGI